MADRRKAEGGGGGAGSQTSPEPDTVNAAAGQTLEDDEA